MHESVVRSGCALAGAAALCLGLLLLLTPLAPLPIFGAVVVSLGLIRALPREPAGSPMRGRVRAFALGALAALLLFGGYLATRE